MLEVLIDFWFEGWDFTREIWVPYRWLKLCCLCWVKLLEWWWWFWWSWLSAALCGIWGQGSWLVGILLLGLSWVPTLWWASFGCWGTFIQFIFPSSFTRRWRWIWAGPSTFQGSPGTVSGRNRLRGRLCGRAEVSRK